MIWTTSVVITTITGDADPYESASAIDGDTVAAHISAPSGTDLAIGGDKEVIDATCYLPAGTTLERGDRITDQADGRAYAVVWRLARRGLGLDHLVAGLRAVEGGASG